MPTTEIDIRGSTPSSVQMCATLATAGGSKENHVRSTAAKALSARCHAVRPTDYFGAFANHSIITTLAAQSGTIGLFRDARTGEDIIAMEYKTKIRYHPFLIRQRQEI